MPTVPTVAHAPDPAQSPVQDTWEPPKLPKPIRVFAYLVAIVLFLYGVISTLAQEERAYAHAQAHASGYASRYEDASWYTEGEW
jgi:hypothetical protein